MYFDGTPAPIDGPCKYRKFDSIFNKYWCPKNNCWVFENCTCEYEEPKYVTYKI